MDTARGPNDPSLASPPEIQQRQKKQRDQQQQQQQQPRRDSLFAWDDDVGVIVHLTPSVQGLPPTRNDEFEEIYSDSTQSPTEAVTDIHLELPDKDNQDVSHPVPKKSGKFAKEVFIEPNVPHPLLDYPPLYYITKKCPCLHEAIKSLFTFRWLISYPFQRRVPWSLGLQRFGISLTWGELVLIIPFFALIVIGTLWSFLDPSPSVTGQVSRLPLIFCFVTALHNSLLTLLLGLPFERALWYHKLSGRLTFINGILHTYVCYFNPNDDLSIDAPPSGKYAHVMFGPYLVYDQVNISGTAILAFVTGILITSLPYVRRKFFELFYVVHVLFALSMAVCAFYHSGKLVPILVAATWGVDLVVRRLLMAGALYPQKARVRIVSPTVVELRFPKTRGFDFNPGQYYFLCVRELSLMEWHPFSISSSPGQRTVSFHIRKAGGWTSALHDLAQTRDEISILLEGPFGSVGVDLMSDRYNSVLLVSGGIGITPMQSICNQLIYEHATGKRTLKKLSFVWIERDPIIVSDLDVVRRSNFPNNGNALDTASVASDQDKPEGDNQLLGMASTILALASPLGDADEDEEDIGNPAGQSQKRLPALSSFRGDFKEMRAISRLSIDASMADGGVDNSLKDDDTFLGAAFDGLVANKSPMDVLDMQVYLTSTDEKSDIRNIPFVHEGRPDIDRLFVKMKELALASGESRVAVCVCAPVKMVDICQKACVKYSDSRLRFDFHSETFT